MSEKGPSWILLDSAGTDVPVCCDESVFLDHRPAILEHIFSSTLQQIGQMHLYVTANLTYRQQREIAKLRSKIKDLIVIHNWMSMVLNSSEDLERKLLPYLENVLQLYPSSTFKLGKDDGLSLSSLGSLLKDAQAGLLLSSSTLENFRHAFFVSETTPFGKKWNKIQALHLKDHFSHSLATGRLPQNAPVQTLLKTLVRELQAQSRAHYLEKSPSGSSQIDSRLQLVPVFPAGPITHPLSDTIIPLKWTISQEQSQEVILPNEIVFIPGDLEIERVVVPAQSPQSTKVRVSKIAYTGPHPLKQGTVSYLLELPGLKSYDVDNDNFPEFVTISASRDPLSCSSFHRVRQVEGFEPIASGPISVTIPHPFDQGKAKPSIFYRDGVLVLEYVGQLSDEPSKSEPSPTE